MDFHTLPRKQLQALCKKNKIPANLTNVAMADSLNALELVEGIEEIMNPSEMEVLKSPIGGRTRTAKTPVAAPTTGTRRRVAAASTSTRRKIEVSSKESLDEVEDAKRDVTAKTPAAAGPVSRTRATRETRRSTRLAANVGEPKERSVAIKISSYNEEVEENVEVEMKEIPVDQSEIPEIIDLEKVEECSEEAEVVKSSDEPKETSEEKPDVINEGNAVDESIEEIVAQEEDVLEIKEKVESEVVKSSDEPKDTSDEKPDVINEGNAVDESIEEIVAQEEDVLEIKEKVESEVVKSSDEPKDTSDEKSDVPNEGDAIVENIEETVAQEEDVVEIKEKVVSEAEVKSNDETKETNEEDVVESVEEIVATDFKIGNAQEEDVVEIKEKVASEVVQECIVTENVCEMETEGLVEDTEIKSNMDEEDKASFEVNDLKPNVDDDQTEASVEEDTDNDETKASVEEDIVVANETNASMEEDTDMNLSVDEEIVVANETKASMEENTDMSLSVDEDIDVAQFEVENEQQTSQNDQEKTSSEVIELKSNVDNETKGFNEEDIDQEKASFEDIDQDKAFEVSELKSGVDYETEVSNEEDTGDDSFNVENEELMVANVTVDMQEDETPDNEESAMSDEVETLDAKEMSDVDCQEEEVDVVASEDETSDKEESVVSGEVEIIDAEESDISDVVVPQAKIQENGNGTTFNQEANQESVMAEAEIEENGNVPEVEVLNSVAEQVSNDDQEEMHFPDVELQADLNSAIGVAPPVQNEDVSSIEPVEKCLNRTPLKSSVKKSKSVGRLNHISDDKENVGSGMKSVILKDKKPKKKDTWEDCSLRELIKRIKQLEISSKHNNEDGKENEDGNFKATTTRPALKPLSQN